MERTGENFEEVSDETLEKHKLVIDHWFVNGFNGTKAYQSIYPGAAYESADASFRKILENTRIKSYIKEKKENAQVILQTSHELLLQELRNWAYSDITETLMLTPDQVKELPADIRRLITKYKTSTRSYKEGDNLITESVVEMWFVDKTKAMEMIHKHTGFYERDNIQKNFNGRPEKIEVEFIDFSENGSSENN